MCFGCRWRSGGIERVDLDLVRVEADQETLSPPFRRTWSSIASARSSSSLYPGDLLRQLPEHTFEIAVHAVDAPRSAAHSDATPCSTAGRWRGHVGPPTQAMRQLLST